MYPINTQTFETQPYSHTLKIYLPFIRTQIELRRNKITFAVLKMICIRYCALCGSNKVRVRFLECTCIGEVEEWAVCIEWSL